MNAQIFDAEQYSALTQQIHQLRADAQQRIQSIRDAIGQLTDELRVVSRSICLEDAAAKIEASISGWEEKRRASVYQSRYPAIQLSTYNQTRAADFSGDGSLLSHDQDTFLPGFYIDRNDHMDILALLWGPKEIKAFALAAALGCGAKPKAEGGLSVDEAMQRHDEIWQQLELLEQARIEAEASFRDIK